MEEKREGEKERMSMSQPGMEPKSERENEGNVCERKTETSTEGQSQRGTRRCSQGTRQREEVPDSDRQEWEDAGE